MPHHADAAVALLAAGLLVSEEAAGLACAAPLGRTRRPQRLFDGDVHGVELMIASEFLGDLAAVILEHDEVADQIEKAALLEHAFQHHLQFGQARGLAIAGDGAPGLEPLAPRAERADARFHAVGRDQHFVGGEQRGDLRLIGFELLEGRPDRGGLVGRVLELDDAKRQAVDEQHDIGTARVLSFHDGELVDRQPVVGVWVREINHARLIAGDGAVLAAVFHRDAVHQHAMERAIAFDRCRRRQARQLAIGVLDRLRWQLRIEPCQRRAQTLLQDRIAIIGIGSLGRRTIDGDVWPVRNRPPEPAQPLQRGFLDDGFGEGAHATAPTILSASFIRISHEVSLGSSALRTAPSVRAFARFPSICALSGRIKISNFRRISSDAHMNRSFGMFRTLSASRIVPESIFVPISSFIASETKHSMRNVGCGKFGLHRMPVIFLPSAAFLPAGICATAPTRPTFVITQSPGFASIRLTHFL